MVALGVDPAQMGEVTRDAVVVADRGRVPLVQGLRAVGAIKQDNMGAHEPLGRTVNLIQQRLLDGIASYGFPRVNKIGVVEILTARGARLAGKMRQTRPLPN